MSKLFIVASIVDILIPVSLAIGLLTNSLGLILLALPLFVLGLILGIFAISRNKLPTWQRATVVAGPFALPALTLAIGRLLG
jgi:hypothetical protein